MIVADRDENGAQMAAEGLCTAGHEAIAVTCDVTEIAQVDAMVERAVSAYGRLDAASTMPG